MSARPPELDAAARAMVRATADFVLIGGFAVIANRFVRATEDIDLLVPDDPDNSAKSTSSAPSTCARVHGPLPIDPIPGLDY